jgi:hypothetical protein
VPSVGVGGRLTALSSPLSLLSPLLPHTAYVLALFCILLALVCISEALKKTGEEGADGLPRDGTDEVAGSNNMPTSNITHTREQEEVSPYAFCLMPSALCPLPSAYFLFRRMSFIRP